MDDWITIGARNNDALREVIGCCEQRGIEIPSAYLKERWHPDAFRFSVIRAALTPPRLVGKPFDSIEKARGWLRDFGPREPQPARFEVIDIAERLIYQVDAKGDLSAPQALAAYRPVTQEALAARKAAKTKSQLESTIKALFGTDSLTPRRREIIETLSKADVSIQSDGGWDLVRIHMPHGKKVFEELFAELFDPESKTPLEFIESYPWGLKYGLAYSFISARQTPAERTACKDCRRGDVPESIRLLSEGRCVRCFCEWYPAADGTPRFPPDPDAFISELTSALRLSPKFLARGNRETLAQLGQMGLRAKTLPGDDPDHELLAIFIPKELDVAVKAILEEIFKGRWYLRFKNSHPDLTFKYTVIKGPRRLDLRAISYRKDPPAGT